MSVKKNVRRASSYVGGLVRPVQLGVSVSAIVLAGTALAPARAAVLNLGGVAVSRTNLDQSPGVPYTGVSNGVLTLNLASALSYNGAFDDSLGVFALTKVGAGVLTLGGTSNSFSGRTLVSAGILRAGAINTLSMNSLLQVASIFDLAGFSQTINGLSGAGQVINSGGLAALTIDSATNRVFTGTIANATTVVKAGTATQTFTGANTYTGGTVLNAGQLSVGNNAALGTGTLTVNGGSLGASANNITLGNAVVLNSNLVSNSGGVSYGLGGTISGSGGITKLGNGTLSLIGSNSFTGGIALQAGGIAVGSDTSLGTGTVNNNVAGSRLTTVGGVNVTLANAFVLNQSLNITLPSSASGFIELSGPISGPSGIYLAAGSGVGTLILRNATTNTGDTNMAAGFIAVGNNAAISSGTGGIFTSGPSGLRALTNGLVIPNHIGAGALFTVDTAGFDMTLSGQIGDRLANAPGSIDKVGAGTLTLTNAVSDYAGPTTVSAGTLNVVGGIASATTVKSGATLSGTGTIAAGVTVADGGTISPGNGAGNIGTLSVGGLALSANSILDFTLGTPNVIGGPTNDLIAVSGALTLDGLLNVTAGSGFGNGTYTLITYGSLAADNGLTVQTLPSGYTPLVSVGLHDGINSVQLLVSPTGPITQYWDGTGAVADGAVSGGSGVWNAGNINWTNVGGTANSNWGSTIGYFTNVGGAVSVVGTQAFQNLFFTVDGYTLSGGALAATGAGGLDVIGGATTTINSTISGAGGISKTGAGNLVLNGANSFNGLGITAGTVTVGSDTAAGTGAIAMADGTTLAAGVTGLTLTNAVSTAGTGTIDSGTGMFTLGGVVSGPGSVTKTGSGNLVLNGANSFNGLGITAGTVTVGTSTAAGTGAIAMANGTTLAAGTSGLTLTNAVSTAGTGTIDSGTGVFTLGGVVSGPGSVTKTGTGTLVLNGANSFNGLGITAGTVTVGTSTAAGTGAIAMANGTTLAAGADGLSLANAVTIAGQSTVDTSTFNLAMTGLVSGAGTLVKAGSGALTLTAANSYTGGTIINAGTLIGTATTFGSGGIVDNGALVFNQAVDASYGPVISGTGSVTKNGAGVLTITGVDTYSGTTTVIAGRLNMLGSNAASATTVQSGATISGTGTTGSLTVLSGGTIAPGNPVGTLSVAGSLSLASGSNYLVDIAGPVSDLIAVSGPASINGANILITPVGVTPSFDLTYTLLTSSAVSGTFNAPGVSNLFGPGFTTLLVYAPTSVKLVLRPGSLLTLAGNNLRPNPKAIAASLDSAVAGGYTPLGLGSLYLLGAADLPGALDQLTGEIHSAERKVALENTRVVRETAFDRLNAGLQPFADSNVATTNGERVTTVWLRGARSAGTSSDDGIGRRLKTSETGVLTGVDTSKDGLTVGALFHYLHTDADINLLGKSTVESTGGAIYAGYRQPNGFALGVGGSYAHDTFKASRAIVIPGLFQTLSSNYSGNTYQGFAEVSYDLAAADTVRIEPFGRVSYTHLKTDDFNEVGGSAALKVYGRKSDLTLTQLGLRGAVDLGVGRFSASAGWQHAGGDRDGLTYVSITQGLTQAGIRASALDKNAAAIEANATVGISKMVSFGLGYSGIIGSNASDHSARATLTVGF